MADFSYNFSIKMYADGADLETISMMNANPMVSGFTTNPTLMKKAGIKNYEDFAKEMIEIVYPKPVSLEVFADDFDEMRVQAKKISNWGDNVYVKVPITNTKGISSADLISQISNEGIKVNVTAIFTERQVEKTVKALSGGADSVISVFAGRIADAGIDPYPLMKKFAKHISDERQIELLWASPREVLNVIQAQECGCSIITMTPDLWVKLENIGKDLDQFSLETVKMFFEDAKSSGFNI